LLSGQNNGTSKSFLMAATAIYWSKAGAISNNALRL
jgi:hypothetical protein